MSEVSPTAGAAGIAVATSSFSAPLTELVGFISGFDSAIVAFSAGLDSTVVLWAALKALGADRVLAVTSNSPSYPLSETEEARRLTREIGLPESRHLLIQTQEMENPAYRDNGPLRCYHCKHELFSSLEALRQEKNMAVVFDGRNVSDGSDYRPGHQAGEEAKVVSPLLECGMDKEAVRAVAREIGLTVADKPASPCLSSRVPHGVAITEEILRQIDRAESGLRALGFSGLRVRYHQELARLELTEEDFTRIADPLVREKVIEVIKSCGFRYVSVDLDGYRSGSMNPANPANLANSASSKNIQ